ncbi:hypothetical protein ACLOJK_001984 [Asimina triloba]
MFVAEFDESTELHEIAQERKSIGMTGSMQLMILYTEGSFIYSAVVTVTQGGRCSSSLTTVIWDLTLTSLFFCCRVPRRTMVSQLVKHERIETTVAKAKEVRRLADRMVQLGKEGTLSAARQATGFVRGDDVLHKLFTELAYRYKDRAGGYTRLLRTRIRVGDAAPMAYIDKNSKAG